MWWWLASVGLAEVPERYRALDDALSTLAERGLFIGEVAAADGPTVVYQRRFGDVPDDARFRIGSVTKSFTAAAILALADDGALTLDDRITDHIPELEGWDRVRLAHLVHHSSGATSMMVAPFAREPSFDEWWSAIRATEQHVPTPPADTAFAYSNGGYILLAEVVRRRSQKSYADFVGHRFFEPLGMVDSAVMPTPGQRLREVEGHVWTGPLGLQPSQRLLPHWLANDYRWDIGGDGAIPSTPADLLRWAHGLRTGRVLSAASTAFLTTPHHDDYAAGWMVTDGLVWHNGALSPHGAYAYVRWDPDGTEAVALLSAVDLMAVTPELRRVVDAALDGTEPPAVDPVQGFVGTLALLSALWTPWWLGLLPVAVYARWSGAKGRRRSAVLSGALVTLGPSIAILATTGFRGVVLALLATGVVAQYRWRTAENTRHPQWLAHAVGAAFVLAVGLLWAMVILLGLYALIADPWVLLTLL